MTFCEGCVRLVRSNVRQEAVAHGRAVLCVFKFSQVAQRHSCGNVANFVNSW